MPISLIQFDQLTFSCSPRAMSELPKPFVLAGRCVRLVAGEAPTVLILGYGLGAMGSVVAWLRPGAQIVGVDPEAEMLEQAHRQLPHNAVLEQADAIDYLKRTRRQYDLVIDDCFELIDEDALRPAHLQRHADLVKNRLALGGVYVRNLLPQEGVTPYRQVADMKREFSYLRFRRFLEWDNVFALASDKPLSRNLLRRLDY